MPARRSIIDRIDAAGRRDPATTMRAMTTM
jgi:hypothetical protein